MNVPHLGRAAWQALVMLLLSVAGALNPAHAACPQIRNWSNADAASFPVPELSTVSVANDPAPYYIHLGTGEPSTKAVTLFAFNGYPRVMRNRTFASSVTLSLASFVDEVQASAVFEQDVAYFARNNSSPGWGYQVLTTEGQAGGANPLVFYRDTVGEKMLSALRRYQNVVIKITLYSDSRTDTVLSQGVTELAARTYQAIDLINRKCGLQPNVVPVIELTTSTGAFERAQFQRDMGMGVMMLRVRDMNGLEDLDFNSLKVYVAGVDKTGHFLGVISRLSAQDRVVYVSDETTAVYALRLDTKQLMGEHNLFNIAWNGDWDVKLRICDRRGACGEKTHRLYFGPYLEVTSFLDKRCIEGVGYSRFIDLRVDFGNNGHDAQAVLLVALGPGDDFLNWRTGYWSASMYDSLGRPMTWYDDSNGLLHVTWPQPATFPSGQVSNDFVVSLPAWARSRSGSLVDLPAGDFTLVYGAMDVGVLGTPYLKGSSTQRLCNR